MRAVLAIHDDELRDQFRRFVESKGFEYVQRSAYSIECEETHIAEVNAAIEAAREHFSRYDDVRIVRFDEHWFPVERARIRFFD